MRISWTNRSYVNDLALQIHKPTLSIQEVRIGFTIGDASTARGFIEPPGLRISARPRPWNLMEIQINSI